MNIINYIILLTGGTMRKNRNIDVNIYSKIKNCILIIFSLAILIAIIVAIVSVNTKIQEDQNLIILQSYREEEIARIESAKKAAIQEISINEIYYGENGIEVELYNPSNYDVNLTGCSLYEDNDIEILVIPEGEIIASKDFTSYLLNGDLKNIVGNGSLLLSRVSLFTDEKILIDSVFIPELLVNESYGRQRDGIMSFRYMTKSIGYSNSGSIAIAKEYPVFSAPSGFYDESFVLEISASEGCEIYYTTDGSIPTGSSERYLGPIQIYDASGNNNVLSARTDISTYAVTAPNKKVDKATIIQAIAVSSKGEISEVVSAIYFVGYKNKSGYKEVPIISIVTPTENLFDYWDGIYVLGAIQDDILIRQSSDWLNANYWIDKRKKAYIQFFEEDRSLSYEGDIELSTFNDIMLNQPKKSFRISNILSQRTEDSILNKYIPDTCDKGDIILSAGRYDMFLMLRERLNQKMMFNRDVITGASDLCAVFLNGEYWGVYNIRSDYNEEYIASIYDMDPDNIIIAKNGMVTSESLKDQLLYNELIEFVTQPDITNEAQVTNVDFSSEEAYCMLANMIDIQSFIDYYCSMIYTANNELLTGNVLMWRTRSKGTGQGNDGLWRWMLYETDKSVAIDNRSTYKMNTFRLNALFNDPFFNAFIKNDSFRKRFIVSFMDIVNNNYNLDSINEFLDNNKSLYMLPAIASYKRFFGVGTVDLYNDGIETIKEFYRYRMEYMEKYIKSVFFDCGELVNVNFKTDVNKCRLKINTSYPTISEDGIWEGKYFNGYNIEIEALCFSGSSFDHWELVNCTSKDDIFQNKISVDLNGENPQIVAVFK